MAASLGLRILVLPEVPALALLESIISWIDRLIHLGVALVHSGLAGASSAIHGLVSWLATLLLIPANICHCLVEFVPERLSARCVLFLHQFSFLFPLDVRLVINISSELLSVQVVDDFGQVVRALLLLAHIHGRFFGSRAHSATAKRVVAILGV